MTMKLLEDQSQGEHTWRKTKAEKGRMKGGGGDQD